MTIQQLKYMIKTVECGSITEAARQLYISQPSLSAALKDLETEFNISIFYRTSKGITLSPDGIEFLSYARQIVEQASLLEQRYTNKKPVKQLCSVSTQHYAFAVNAFVKLISEINAEEYEFTLRETRTYEIIDDVANFRSEVGILYFSSFNEKVLKKLLAEKQLSFSPLFDADPHVFVSVAHPLASCNCVTLHDLAEYPFLAFEQGTYNSFYFSEEILSTETHKKIIHVSDRATLFNLLIGLNGYTICSGVLNSNLNGDQITTVKLNTDETMKIGIVIHKKATLSAITLRYIEHLKALISANGYPVLLE